MALELRQQLRLSQQLIMTPQLQMAIKLLQLSHLELLDAIQQEMEENAALEIARALASDPKFILLDEPFAGIDPLAVNEIQNIIRQLAKRDIGVLISDHNVRETLTVCDFAYILNEGRVIESGVPDAIAQSPVARRFYLGEDFRF